MNYLSTAGLSLAHRELLKAKGYTSLLEVALEPWATFNRNLQDSLTDAARRHIHETAQRTLMVLKELQARIRTHANPQLRRMRHLNPAALARETREYSAYFGQRAETYVRDGSVASLFSPAAYLTELYREGRPLHLDSSPYHLDRRRPDLKNLLLSQAHLDEVFTTLSGANRVIGAAIVASGRVEMDMDQKLAGATFPLDLPHHQPFETLIQALARHNTDFSTLADAWLHQIEGSLDTPVCICFETHLSPELYDLVTTAISGDSTQLAAHFGAATADQLADVTFLCRCLAISRDMLNSLIVTPGYAESAGAFAGNEAPTYFDDIQQAVPITGREYGSRYMVASTMSGSPEAPSGTVLQVCDGQLKWVNLAQTSFDNPQHVAACYALASSKQNHIRLVFRSAVQWTENSFAIKLSVDGVPVLERSLIGNPSSFCLTVDVPLPAAGESFLLEARVNDASPTAATVTVESIAAVGNNFFIKMSNLVRLHKQAGLPLETIDAMIGVNGNVDQNLLEGCALVSRYGRDYGINVEDAMVLAGEPINIYARIGKLSQFDRLFNHPPLGEALFRLDGATVDLAEADHAVERGTLTRAFNTDDAGLLTLVGLFKGVGQTQITKTIGDVSALYRLALLARLEVLSPRELALIFEILGLGFNDDLVTSVASCRAWSEAQQLTLDVLQAMTTVDYPVTMTAEIRYFLETLSRLEVEVDANDGQVTDPDLHDKLAPTICGFFRLESKACGLLLQLWLESIASLRGLALATTADFYVALNGYVANPTAQAEADLAAFCHGLAQLALIIRHFALKETELGWIVNRPELIHSGSSPFDACFANLVSLAHLQTWQAACGGQVDRAMAELEAGDLDAAALATLLNEDPNEVGAAWDELLPAGTTALPSSHDGYRIFQALVSAHGVGVTVAVLSELFALELLTPFDDWRDCAGNYLSAVPADQLGRHQGELDELLSTALCAFYLDQVVPTLNGVMLSSREDLFHFLLIDNQVSHELETTAIASAIESLQTYIHRCLQQSEPDTQALSAFFDDWDTYNSRYGNWAGLSQLVYYPENYLDPALRYQKTNLQDQLNLEISQGRLTEDLANIAYLHYLDGFEEIANLDFLCGYHDELDLDSGKTYFVARTMVAPYRYYWRCLEQAEQDQNGNYWPTAWSNWESIDMPISALNNEVRPVIFNGRLYLGWFEKRFVEDESYAVAGESRPLEKTFFMLGFRLINGKWSAPVTYDLAVEPAAFRFHLAYYTALDGITLRVYDPSSQQAGQELSLYINHTLALNPIEGQTETDWLALIQNHLDTNTQPATILIRKITVGVETDHYFTEKKYEAVFLADTRSPYRSRLNTLFARELIKRTFAGLRRLFTWATQNLQEPRLGIGRYVYFDFPTYDQTVHGFGGRYTIRLTNTDYSRDFQLAEGWVSRTESSRIRVFVPYTGNESQSLSQSPPEVVIHIGIGFEGLDLPADPTAESQRFRVNPDQDTFEPYTGDGGDNSNRTPGLTGSVVDSCLSEPMDFYGANGLYFWELFYYTPMLLARRMLEAANFTESKTWLGYVFSPKGYPEDRPRFWNVRPLQEDLAWNPQPLDDSDPDRIALSDPMHYKVYTFTLLLDLLLAEGDSAYRKLERDSLTEAKLWYLQASDLLGEQPDLPMANEWADPSLAEAAAQSTAADAFQALENIALGRVLDEDAANRSANTLTAVFLPPLNQKLQGYWLTLRQRFYNLRHNLSIDGQPLQLPIFAAPADPKVLQRAAAAGYNGAGGLPTAQISIFRFPRALEMARGLVDQNIQFGTNLLATLTQKDNSAMQSLMQEQAAASTNLAIQIQSKTLEELEKQKAELAANLTATSQKLTTYQNLIEGNISEDEQQSIDLRISAGVLMIAGTTFRIAGAGVSLVPNLFGVATGGSVWGAGAAATADIMDTVATTAMVDADAIDLKESFRRRLQDWEIQRDELQFQYDQLTVQDKALDIQIEAADLQRESLLLQLEQTGRQLDFLRTRFSNEKLYSWMQGRLAGFYHQLYDLAVSRCLRAEKCYQFETGDTRIFIQPAAWDDNYAGLLAGETLQFYLAQMESAYLQWDARTLEVDRTVSLAVAMSLPDAEGSFNDHLTSVLGGGSFSANSHALSLEADDDTLVATINLAALELFADYPETLGPVRCIKQVSVTLPALLGPYQDIRAVLAYSGDNIAIHESCKRIAVSHGQNDSGLFQLNWGDDKYLPFEGLAIDDPGSLQLSFPDATGTQAQLLAALTDIILHIRYTIRD